MKYAYVVSNENRTVTQIDFTDKTAICLCEYDDGDFDIGPLYTWDAENNLNCAEHVSIEEIVAGLGKAEVIIPSDLLLKEIYGFVNDPQYEPYGDSFDVCSKMLDAYSRFVTEISLGDLIQAMR